MSHLGSLRIILTPQDQFFLGLDPELTELAKQIIGCIEVPGDQPRFSQVVNCLSRSLITFSGRYQFYREVTTHQTNLAFRLADYAEGQSQLDTTPLIHMNGRLGTNGAWAFCMELDPESIELSIALGAELALAMAEGRRLQQHFVDHLRRDLGNVPKPEFVTAQTEADMQALGFGKQWRQALNGKVKRLQAILMSSNGGRIGHRSDLSDVGDEQKAHLLGTALNSDPKDRTGVRNHRQLTPPQMGEYQADLRLRLEQATPGAVVEALCLFTGMNERGVTTLALGTQALPGEVLTLDLENGGLHVALNHLVERRRLELDPGQIYQPSEPSYFIPWPTNLVTALKKMAAGEAKAASKRWPVIRLVDILPQTERDHQLQAGVSAISKQRLSAHGLTPTSARARNTFPTQGKDFGMKSTNRSLAFLRLDLVGRARPWYVCIESEDFTADWCRFLSSEGWTINGSAIASAYAFGSPYLLKESALQAIWSCYVQRVEDLPKGKRMSLATAIDIHNAYADFTAMAISFLLGLRPSVQYELTADTARPDAALLTLTDKSDPSKSGSRFAALTGIVRGLLANWYAHCEALLGRYQRDPHIGKTTVGKEVLLHLIQVGNHANVPVLFRIFKNGIRPANSKTTWNALPPLLRCEENVGRHYWATHLHRAGCSDKVLDLFLRHTVAGNSPTSAYGNTTLAQLIQEVEAVQSTHIAKLGLKMATGLRKA